MSCVPVGMDLQIPACVDLRPVNRLPAFIAAAPGFIIPVLRRDTSGLRPSGGAPGNWVEC